MVLTKALKAKISSIPSEVTSLSTPSLDLRMAAKRTVASVMGLRSTTRRGDRSHTCGASLEGLSRCGCVYGSHRASGALSLSVEEGRSTFGVMVGIWDKF